MPNVSTIAESGYPGFNATNWYAFVAPGKAPAAVLDRWNAELVKALNSPEVKAELDKHRLTPASGSREELARIIAAESQAWGQLTRVHPARIAFIPLDERVGGIAAGGAGGEWPVSGGPAS